MSSTTSVPMNAAVFRVENLRVGFADDAGAMNPLVDLSFWTPAGGVLAVVGASAPESPSRCGRWAGCFPTGSPRRGASRSPTGACRSWAPA